MKLIRVEENLGHTRLDNGPIWISYTVAFHPGRQDPNIDKSWKKVERSGHACHKDQPRGYVFLPRNDLCFNRNCSSSTAPLSPPTVHNAWYPPVFPVRLWTDLSSSCKREGKKKERGGERKRFQFNPCQSICLLRIESFVIDELLRVMYTTCNEFGYLKEKRKRKKRKKKRGEERKRKRETTVQPTVLKNFHRLPGFLPFFLFFFSFSSGRAASAARRFGSMRAQMGLCLMKFGPSCTCHFRGISDRRPLHCLEHNLRNWREPTPPSSRFDPPRYISDSTFLVL